MSLVSNRTHTENQLVQRSAKNVNASAAVCAMATQKPGEWANTLIIRFEEQVSPQCPYSILAGSHQNGCLSVRNQ